MVYSLVFAWFWLYINDIIWHICVYTYYFHYWWNSLRVFVLFSSWFIHVLCAAEYWSIMGKYHSLSIVLSVGTWEFSSCLFSFMSNNMLRIDFKSFLHESRACSSLIWMQIIELATSRDTTIHVTHSLSFIWRDYGIFLHISSDQSSELLPTFQVAS